MTELASLAYLGDAAVSATFAGGEPLAVNARVHAAAAAVRRAALPGVRDVVPGMRELVVHVDPLRCDVDRVVRILEGPATDPLPEPSGPVVEVPIVYGGIEGADLHDVAARCGLHVDDVCEHHAAVEYMVCFIGFLPGFPYLGLLDPRLRLPRRQTPRPRVPPGAVAIAGEYTGIYPWHSPGGWHLIGHSPMRLFDADAPAPATLTPGTRIRFTPQ